MLRINRGLILMAIIFGLVFAGIVNFSYAANTPKIGYVDVAKVFDAYERTKESDKVLEKEGKGKQEQRDKIVEEIKKLKDKAEMLNAKAKEQKQEVIDNKIRELQDFDREANSTLKKERDEMVKDILKDIDKVISEYGKSEDFSIILNDRTLVYGSEQLNVTDQIIKRLNERYKKR